MHISAQETQYQRFIPVCNRVSRFRKSKVKRLNCQKEILGLHILRIGNSWVVLVKLNGVFVFEIRIKNQRPICSFHATSVSLGHFSASEESILSVCYLQKGHWKLHRRGQRTAHNGRPDNCGEQPLTIHLRRPASEIQQGFQLVWRLSHECFS